jgi:phosphate transport system protein
MESQGQVRHAFTSELQSLEHDLLEMGSRAETMVGMAADSLTRLDTALAREVLVRDDDIDDRDRAIENHCLRLIALQQPIAGDLRVVSTAMKMITDIERIGDLAVDIARITLKVDKEFGETGIIDIPKIANVARQMLRLALEAYVRRDLDLVRQVVAMDDEVDALYRSLREHIFVVMRGNPEHVVSHSWLLLAIHHVERIADHAVNIAERISFMVTGETKESPGHHQED